MIKSFHLTPPSFLPPLKIRGGITVKSLLNLSPSIIKLKGEREEGKND